MHSGVPSSTATKDLAASSPTAFESKVKPSEVKTEVETIEGTGLWNVKRFSKLDSTLGFNVFSPEFQMAGEWWKLQLFPGGAGGIIEGRSSEGYISVYLYATRAKQQGTYSLQLKASTPPSTATPSIAGPTVATELATPPPLEPKHQGSLRVFSSPAEGWGFLRVYPRDELLKGWWAIRDEINIEVTVSLIKGIALKPDTRNPGGMKLQYLGGLQENLLHMFKDPGGTFSDIRIRLGGEGRPEFRVHKCILAARSPYFRALLHSGMKEVQEGVIQLDFCRSDVITAFLTYLYSGGCDLAKLIAHRETQGSTQSSSHDLQGLEADDSEVTSGSSADIEARKPDVTSGSSAYLKARKAEEINIQKIIKKYSVLSLSELEDGKGDFVLELLLTAHRFDVQQLQITCEHFLSDTLAPENCLDRLRMCVMLGLSPGLYAKTFKYISDLTPLIKRNTPRYKEALRRLRQDCPDTYDELHLEQVPESHRFSVTTPPLPAPASTGETSSRPSVGAATIIPVALPPPTAVAAATSAPSGPPLPAEPILFTHLAAPPLAPASVPAPLATPPSVVAAPTLPTAAPIPFSLLSAPPLAIPPPTTLPPIRQLIAIPPRSETTSSHTLDEGSPTSRKRPSIAPAETPDSPRTAAPTATERAGGGGGGGGSAISEATQPKRLRPENTVTTIGSDPRTSQSGLFSPRGDTTSGGSTSLSLPLPRRP